MYKKSQMVGQIFIFVLAIVLIGFILLFGYNSIAKFKGKMDNVALVKLKSDLASEVQTISADYGSVKISDFDISEGVTDVCFIHTHPYMPTDINSDYPIMDDSVESGAKKNVFLIKDNTVEESFFIGAIALTENFKCFDVVANKIKVKFEGAGNHAKISE